MRLGRNARAALVLAGALLAFGMGRATARGKPDSNIVGVFGVGGVLTESGALWQFLPDEKKWMTIDQAFARDGRETHVLPLPVDVKSIRFMESWGFLVTTEGKAWLYSQDESKWIEIGTP
jgi:hypothetical protein